MSPPGTLAAALLPRYRIERELGVGGMATVYLAHDEKHERDVAIKVLKPELAAVVGAERFIAEIRTTAHLRHPHILPLFDSGSADGLPFYVMPYVDGESLRARLRREGALPIAEATSIIREVADALAHAHESGVIHRDVKPDNVLISGRHVFLADFGVARALAAQATGDNTITGTGLMLGTPAYMAPEQVAAGSVDHRTDIYALGVLAYELLAGAPPFQGSAQDVVTSQLTEPAAPVSTHRTEIPEALARAVMRCLEKRPERRFQRVDEILPALDAAASEEVAALSGVALRKSKPRRRWVTAGLVGAAAVTVGWFATHSNRSAGSLAVGRIMRVTTEPGLELDPAISPDGRAIAYAAGVPGQMRIFVRQITGGRMVALTDEGTASGQRWPQWSPDGSRLVFQAGGARVATRSAESVGMLFQVPALGGVASRIVANAPKGIALSPAWSPDGRRIAFGGLDGLYGVAADGHDEPRLLAPGGEVHSPSWSPDGSRIAYVSRGIYFTFGEENLGNVSTSTIFVVSARGGPVTQITSGDWLDINPVWMPDSRTLLFVSSRGGGRDVFRMHIPRRGAPEEEPARISSGLNAHGISISADGKLLAYASYTPRANIWAVDIPQDRVASVREALQVTSGNEKIEKLAVSWDGQWVAYDSDRNGQADIWKMRISGGTPEQVTTGPNHEFVNDWSPDGREIVFHSMREGGQRDVLVVSADGTKTEPVATSPAEEQHSAWGPDGNSIVFDADSPGKKGNQVYVVTRRERGAPWGTPRRLTSLGSSDPKWSPDGRLIAYCVTGQLHVMAPDGTGDRVLVSTRNIAEQPEPSYAIWARDSQTIYYKAYDERRQSSIWAVSVSGGPPRLLVRFDDPARRSLRREFATDGHRFYFTIAHEESDLWAMELISK